MELFSVSFKTQSIDATFYKVCVSWEGHKIWKNLRRTFDKSTAICARNRVLVKKLTKIFQKNVVKSYYTNFNIRYKEFFLLHTFLSFQIMISD